MPAFLYSRQGISSPANAEGIPEHFFHARKSRWPAGDKSPAGRNPRRPNAGLRFGKRSASETGFFLARYRAENRCRLIGRHTCTASLRRSQTFPKSAARLAANRMVHPPARRCAATAFFRREKGSKTRRSPAANGMRPAAPPTPPNRWSKTPSSSCSRGAQISFFPLTSAAVHSRRRPAYLQQIDPKQNVP